MSSEQHHKKSGWWRMAQRVLISLAIGIVLLGCFGAALNFLVVRHDRSANPPPGRIYKVNDHAMHIYCTGSGSPTLVLESGHGEDFTVWGKVQPSLSKVTRTCSYDRAGFGWSATQPGELDAEHIADRLHALLLSAGITTPIILEGHSAGGLYARVYASKFPKDVAGVVLVDATSPTPLPQPSFSKALDHHSEAEFAFVKAAVGLGVARLMGQCDSVPDGLEAYARWIKASACYYPQLDAYAREDRALDKSRKQGASTGPFGDLPILILSQDPKKQIPSFLQKRVSSNDWALSTSAHDKDQAAYLQLSTRTQRVIASGSGHYIQYDRPDVVIQETTKFIEQMRKTSASI